MLSKSNKVLYYLVSFMSEKHFDQIEDDDHEGCNEGEEE